MTKIELKLTELGTDMFIYEGDIFYDIKERPRRYQVAKATFGCIPQFMLCALDLYDSKGHIIATSAIKTDYINTDYISNLPTSVEGLPKDFVRAYVAGGCVNHRVCFNGNVSEIYYLSDDKQIIDELSIEPEPVANFILEQEDIKPIMTHNGAYYHYADVCKLIKKLKEEVNELAKERKAHKEQKSQTDLHTQEERYKKLL